MSVHFVIDFAPQCCRIAPLVFHCVGSAITNNAAVPRTQQEQERDNFQINLKSSLSYFWLYEQRIVFYCSRTPCDPVGARTQDLQLRRLLLYPTELRNQSIYLLSPQSCLSMEQFGTIHLPLLCNPLGPQKYTYFLVYARPQGAEWSHPAP